MKNNFEKIAFILIIIILFFVGLKMCGDKKLKQKETINIYESINNDSLIHYRNKYDEATSSISILQGNNTDLIKNIKTKDKTINWLKEEVEKYKKNIKNSGSVTVIETNTNFNGTTPTTVISTPIIKDSIVYEKQTFETDSKDTTWIKYHIKSNSDSTSIKLKIKNQYTVVIGEEKVGFLKKRPVVLVTNKNPYSTVSQLRTYEVINNYRNKITLGLQAGYGLGLLNFKPQPFIGIGINYKLLGLW